MPVVPVTRQLLNGEPLHSLAAVAASLPGHRRNAHVNAATVFRWITRGVRAADGELVRLEAVRLGTAWRTSSEAVARFSARLTSAAQPNDARVPAARSERSRPRSAASDELDRLWAHRGGAGGT